MPVLGGRASSNGAFPNAICPKFHFMAINVGRLVGQNPIILIHKFYQ